MKAPASRQLSIGMALALLSVGTAWAAPAPPPGAVRLLHWARMPVRVYLTPSPAATEERRARARLGFDEWVRASHGAVGYQVVKDPAQADLSVVFDPDAFLPGRKGVTGSTTVVSSGDAITQGCIELAAGQDTPEELQRAAAHEFGHALGIEGHSNNSGDLMYPVEYRILPAPSLSLAFGAGALSSPSAQGVTAGDLRLLRACYPILFAAAMPRP